MTEEEARNKWCPFARVFTGTSNWVAAANRNLLDKNKHMNKCIGSYCMAWTCSGCGLVAAPKPEDVK